MPPRLSKSPIIAFGNRNNIVFHELILSSKRAPIKVVPIAKGDKWTFGGPKCTKKKKKVRTQNRY